MTKEVAGTPCNDSLCPVDSWNAFVDGTADRIDSALLEDGGIASVALQHIDGLNQLRSKADLPAEMRDGVEQMIEQLHSGMRKMLEITDEGRAMRFDMPRVRQACLEGTSATETEMGCRRLCGSLAINESERQDFSLPTA